MASGDSITYTKRESSQEIFPDNSNFDWDGWTDNDAKNTSSVELKADTWYRSLKERFESFEHDPKSSIYRYYDHDYDDPKGRVIKMPNGSMSSGNVNRMTEQLPEALLYRLKNADNDKKNGWKVFERITGRYDVEAADEETLKERMKTLTRFMELIKEDEYLAKYDPLTNQEAITQINATGEMDSIEYTFPLGLENTDFLHYMVYEPEVISANIENEQQIEDIVRYEILNYIDVRSETLMPKRGIGVVMSKHGNVLRPHVGYIQSILSDIVGEYNKILESKGVKAISKLLSTMELPTTQDEVNEDNLVETYKKISVSALLKKIKSKPLIKRLNRIKPPSEGKAGGITWPVSAGGNYMLWITTDPFEMLTKSTGRKWSERNASCENWDGCYAEGPVSDVKYGNCIVWVYKQGDEEYRHEIGRFLLRWGDAYKGGEKIGYDIGVEAQVYPKDPRESPWGFNLLGAIGQILKDAGFLNYDTCNTPYKYLGYSDKASSGKVKINYDSKIFLRGQGEVEVGNANALVSMASDEALSYADSGYVLNYGNSQALVALSQNPVVWIYENTIRRLFTRALDIEEGSQIVRFLIDSSVANFDWIIGTLDTMEIFDDNYYNYLNYTQSYLNFLLRSPLCTDRAHQAILDSHPGYTIGEDLNLPLWSTAYLNILKTNMGEAPILTTAPASILDEITNEVIQKQYMADFVEVPVSEGNPVKMVDVAIGNEGFYDFPSPKSQKLLRKYIFKMQSMKQLIYQPKLSLKSYGKLLTDFSKIWKKRLGDEGPFDKVLLKLRNHFAITLCVPLQNCDDWGYTHHFGGMTLNFKNADLGFRKISTIVDGDEINYPIFNRQSAGTVRRMMEIYPELVIDGHSDDWEDGGDHSYNGLLLRNIRVAGGFKEMILNPAIKRPHLLRRLKNPQKEDETIPNPFINANTNAIIYKNMVAADFNDYQIEYQSITGEPIYRESAPAPVVNYLLDNFSIVLEYIPISLFAMWLRTPAQFTAFTEKVLESAIGHYSLETNWRDFEIDYGEIDLDTHFETIANIDLLSMAAYNSHSTPQPQGGLASNPYIPNETQETILVKWPLISEVFGGEYEINFNKLLTDLSLNPNVSPESISEILSQDPDMRDIILSNAKISMTDELVKTVFEENPSLILKNYNLNIRSYLSVYKEWLKIISKNPSGDEERFAKYFKIGSQERVASIKNYIDPDYNDLYYALRNKTDEMNWLRYWRGGTFKKKMSLGMANNAAPYNADKDRPMALVDSPIPIPYEHLIYVANATRDDEAIILSNVVLKYIKTVTIQNELIEVSGIKYMVGDDGELVKEPFTTTYNSFDEMYSYIPEDRRQEDPERKWSQDLIMVFFDSVDSSQSETLPQWRLNTTKSDIEATLLDIMKNPKMDEDKIISIMPKGAIQYMAERGSGTISIFNYLQAIDKSDSWTPKIINTYKSPCFAQGTDYYMNFRNLAPTNELFDISISEDDEFILGQLGILRRRIPHLQLWILNERFEDILPIQYIYSCITLPHISADVKARAKQIRQKRLGEYLTLMRRDEDIQVNDAEDTHSYEWRVFNSQVNNILIKYCELMYPHDVKMQERLMDDIISGRTHIGIEDMNSVLRGKR